MKLRINISPSRLLLPVFLFSTLALSQTTLRAQEIPVTTDTTTTVEEVAAPVKAKPVKNTFNSIWIIDNQSVMVPAKGTFESDIMHRFGTVQKGYDDFWGFFAPSNIRLGFSYAPIKNLNLGFGLTKSNMLFDGSAKYAIIQQTPGSYPVSVTYYGNIAYASLRDPDGSIYKYQSQRWSFFNSLIIARKITENLSIQISPSVSHQNSVNGYYTKNDSTGSETFKEMKFDHFALAVSARYKLTPGTSIIFNYDQPLTEHPTNNPHPNFSFGLEFVSSGHAFQVFAGNYYLLSPQRNNLYNTNNPFGYTDDQDNKVEGGQFLIGFNITRMWAW
jgi:hypothetical protein